MNRLVLLGLVPVLLSACASPYRIPAYTAAPAAAAAATSALSGKDLALGSFEEAGFDRSCRGLQTLALPDDQTPGQYIRKALEQELRTAGANVGPAPKFTLTGKLEQVGFSSSAAITMGVWSLDLTLRSSNGQSIRVSESFEFDSGFAYQEACRNVANAFPKAVQGLLRKATEHPGLSSLVR